MVIWVTGGLQGEWLPHGEYGKPLAGGLSRIARALDLHRQPGDLLVDLGRFRYPRGVAGETRWRRIRADGFLKSLLRLQYTCLNVSLLDLPPWPPELAARAREYGLPLTSCNLGSEDLLFPPSVTVSYADAEIQIICLSGGWNEFRSWLRPAEPAHENSIPKGTYKILLTDASEGNILELAQNLPEIDLIIWLNEGEPAVRELSGIPVLGMGDGGNCLGRIEIRDVGGRINLDESDLSGWLDGKPYRHHPARERVFHDWLFWKEKPSLRASLWEVPEALSPQKQAEAQRQQTEREASRLNDLEEIHRFTPTEFAGPDRCMECHLSNHPRDLASLHLIARPEVRDYPIYERCLPCHATGFDDPGGFLLPRERPDLLAVTCEACHGAAYEHALEGSSPYPSIPEETICQDCHNPEVFPLNHLTFSPAFPSPLPTVHTVVLAPGARNPFPLGRTLFPVSGSPLLTARR